MFTTARFVRQGGLGRFDMLVKILLAKIKYSNMQILTSHKNEQLNELGSKLFEIFDLIQQ